MDKNLKAKCAIRALNIASAMEDSDEVSEDAISSVQRTLKSGPTANLYYIFVLFIVNKTSFIFKLGF